MAAVQISSFTPDASIGTSFGFASVAVALPGTPASDVMVRVCNLGPTPVAVKLGTTNAVTVTSSTGMVIAAGETVYITIGANLFIAGVACAGPNNASTVNLTTGS
jgi:hypothetical protein